MKLDFLEQFDFFAGVPDSLLKPLCNYLMDRYGISDRHIIAANEGNAVALAAGYHLATDKVPVVYLQNSGIGNIVNPVASLLNNKVYEIPCFFIVGWRGEPGVHDEPQHVFQGEITLSLLENIGIHTKVVDKDTSESEIHRIMSDFTDLLNNKQQVALVVKKGAFEYSSSTKYKNSSTLMREDIIRCITDISENDVIVSTTGKASRELFEIRENSSKPHAYDFLTVGSMGHSSSIALGIALQHPHRKVWIVDGDGAALMHLGGMAVLGAIAPKNIIHVIINNESHETVGGMPTVASKIDFISIAKGCNYTNVACVDNLNCLRQELTKAKNIGQLSMIEVKCSIGSRSDLGRPTTSAKENKEQFMNNLLKEE